MAAQRVHALHASSLHAPALPLFPGRRRFWFHRRMSKASLAAIVRYCDQSLRTADGAGLRAGGQRPAGRERWHGHAASPRRWTPAWRPSGWPRAAKRTCCWCITACSGGPRTPGPGKRYELIRCLVEHNLAVYSSHLPLDAHPRLGNNARLCAALGLKKLRPFFFDHGHVPGLSRPRQSSPAPALRRACNARPAQRRRVIPAGPTSAAASAWSAAARAAT